MKSTKINWANKFKYDPTFFNQNEEYKKIYFLIDNHLTDKSIEYIRDSKISEILEEDTNELEYLNPFLDILESKIFKIMNSPVSIINYLEKLSTPREVNGSMVDHEVSQMSVYADSIKYNSIEEFEKEVNEKIKNGYKILPYQIIEQLGEIIFRGAFIIIPGEELTIGTG